MSLVVNPLAVQNDVLMTKIDALLMFGLLGRSKSKLGYSVEQCMRKIHATQPGERDAKCRIATEVRAFLQGATPAIVNYVASNLTIRNNMPTQDVIDAILMNKFE